MKKRRAVLVGFMITAIALAVLPAGGCGDAGQEVVEEAGSAWVQTEIYFGAALPAGGDVSDADFQRFLQEVVTPEFPAGLTVFDAYGQMQDEGAPITRQNTRVVLLVHEKNEENGTAVKRVIEAYRERFGSPQVMHTTQAVEPEFFPAGPE